MGWSRQAADKFSQNSNCTKGDILRTSLLVFVKISVHGDARLPADPLAQLEFLTQKKFTVFEASGVSTPAY